MKNCQGVWAPLEVSVFTAIITAVLCVLTCFGNILVIFSVARNKYNKFRSPFIILVANLASADLIVGVVVEPVTVYTASLEALKHPINIQSIVVHYSYFLSCTASVLTLAFITLDRFLANSTPFWYRSTVTTKKAILLSFFIWCIACVFSGLYFEVGFISYSFVFIHTSVLFTSSVSFFTTIRTIKKFKARVSDLSYNAALRKTVTREKKITQTFLVMLTFFLVSYFPSLIMNYLLNFCSFCGCTLVHWLRDLHFLTIIANSSVDPFIYAFRMPIFKQAFLRYTCSTCCKCIINPLPDLEDPSRLSIRRMAVTPSNLLSLKNLDVAKTSASSQIKEGSRIVAVGMRSPLPSSSVPMTTVD